MARYTTRDQLNAVRDAREQRRADRLFQDEQRFDTIARQERQGREGPFVVNSSIPASQGRRYREMQNAAFWGEGVDSTEVPDTDAPSATAEGETPEMPEEAIGGAPEASIDGVDENIDGIEIDAEAMSEFTSQMPQTSIERSMASVKSILGDMRYGHPEQPLRTPSGAFKLFG